jgi:hypothetical protein
MVSLVASDSPTESLNRLSTSFKDVFSCCRGVKESVSISPHVSSACRRDT